jgi:DNA-directed RNA polymerase I subunit RPA2
MLQKLYALAAGACQPDNPDAPSNHELLLPGHLMQFYLKEKVADWLTAIRDGIAQEARRQPAIDLRDGTRAERVSE